MRVISPSESPYSGRAAPVVLGIDPSISQCGWGVIHGSIALAHGLIRTKPVDLEFVRYHQIHVALEQVIAEYNPAVAAIEQFASFYLSSDGGPGAGEARRGKHHRGRANPKAMFMLKGAQTVIVQTCLAHGLGVVLYLPNQWKKSGTGKEEVKQLVNARFGLTLKNDNITDALGIADHFSRVGRHKDAVLIAT